MIDYLKVSANLPLQRGCAGARLLRGDRHARQLQLEHRQTHPQGPTTSNPHKPHLTPHLLQVLQDHFGSMIHTAHIIKPDKFWQKSLTNLGSQKYKFEVRYNSCTSRNFCSPCAS